MIDLRVSIEKACKYYSGVKVLNLENLDFKDGMIYCILGLNGSGKSTLLNCIAGVEKLDEGLIKYEDGNTLEQVRKDISIFVQKPYLFNKSVLENIKIGLKFRKFKEGKLQERIDKYLPYFDMNELLNKNAKKLSGGEGARTALLRTAVLETGLTLLDEPTASMDAESTFKAENLIKDMALDRRTVIMVTHNFYQAQRLADYVIFMDKGEVIEEGIKQKVLVNPEHKLIKQLLNL